MKPQRLSAVMLLMFVIGCVAPVFGQSDRGTVRGTVTDPNEGVIAGATVVLTSIETNQTREATTSEGGIFVFPELTPGLYRMTVEAGGFKRTAIDNIKVDVQGTQSLAVKLEVGEITGNVVNIDAESVTINTDTPVRQSTVTERQVRELPLQVGSESDGRTPLAFIFLDSNVGSTNQNGENNSARFRVSGGQGLGTEILVDGASTRRTQNGTFFSEIAPGPNAYREFTISTNSYSAEFGNSSGGVVNFNLKSGTNEFHGEGYEFLRNEVLNANSLTNNARGFERNRDNQNNFGFNIGGPLYIPNFGEGTPGGFLRSLKDRAFFFFNYEYYRFILGANSITTVPTARMRLGDFGEFLTDPVVLARFPGGVRIFDPRQPSNIRPQFAGNIIPQSAFDPAGFAILQFFPLPNRPGVRDNYVSSVAVPRVSYNMTIKTDFVLTEKQRLTFSYSRRDNERIVGQPILPLPFTNAFDPFAQTFRSNLGRIQHDYTISSNLLNHFNLGYTFTDVRNGNTTFPFDTSSLGIPRNATANLAFPLIDFVGDSNNPASPRFNVDIGSTDFTDRLRDGALEIGDFVTFITGRQTIKFGASIRLTQFNVTQSLHPGGRFGFHEDQTSRDDVANSGHAVASLITGATEWSFTENNSIDPAFRQMSQSYFIQDDIKVTRKLTVNVGLRYDLPGARVEAKDRFRTFDPDVINPAIGRRGALVGAAGQGGLQAEFRSLAPEDKTNIGPRLGAAYALNDKTVIRAGAGLYYAPILYGLNGNGSIKNGTIGYSNDVLFTPNGRNTPPNQFLSTFRPLVPVDPAAQFVGDTGVVLPFFDKNFKTGRTFQFTVDIQRELPWNMVASVGYIGHRADRLRSNFGRLNALPLNFLRLGFPILDKNINDLNAADRAYATSIGITLPANANAVYPGFNGNVAQALRPFPQYGTNIENYLESQGVSNYNALQLKLDRRFAQGVQFGMSYTFSRLITNAAEDVLGGGSALTGVLQNPFDRSSLKTVSVTNSPHVFVVNFLAELPFGKGKKFLDQGGWVNAIFGGFQVSGIFRYQQGTPLVIALDPNLSGAGNFLQLAGYNGNLRPNLTGAPIRLNTRTPAPTFPGRFFVLNPAAFSAPRNFATPNAAVGTAAYAAYYADPSVFFGNAPAVIEDVRSAPFFSENLSILKKTRITERVTLELGAEFFNVFNRVRFFPPDTFLGRPNATGFDNGNFGAEGAVDTPRSIQLRARIVF